MRRAAPTEDEINKALDRAANGKGRQLAIMVKSFSEKDLTWAFSRSLNLPYALSFAAGAKQAREEFNADMKKFRQERQQAAK